MTNPPHKLTVALVSGALVLSVAGIELGNRTASAAEPGWTHTVTQLPATDDTFVSRESPQWSAGSLDRLIVANTNGQLRAAYLKFVVPRSLLGGNGQIESVVLGLTSTMSAQSGVSVRTTKGTTWTQATMDFANAPVGGATIANLVQGAGGVSSADVTSSVPVPGTFAFQLTTAAGVSRFYSSEHGSSAPTLTVTVKRPPVTPTPTPTPTATSTPTPTTTPTPTRTRQQRPHRLAPRHRRRPRHPHRHGHQLPPRHPHQHGHQLPPRRLLQHRRPRPTRGRGAAGHVRTELAVGPTGQ